jgi:hypothetical protein
VSHSRHSGTSRRTRQKTQTATDLERVVLKLARRAVPLFRSTDPHADKCSALGVSADTPENRLHEPIYARIATTLAESSADNHVNIRDLQRHLWLRHLCDGVRTLDAIAILDVLRDAANQNGGFMPSISSETIWSSSFELARTQLENTTNSRRPSVHDARIYAVASAAKFLRQSGFTVPIVDGRTDDSKFSSKLAWSIDTMVGAYGGVALAEWIFRKLRPVHSADFRRYVIAPHTHTGMPTNTSPMIPFGYLLNLAAKHAGSNGDGDPETLKQIVELSTHFAATINVQHYYSLEGMFNDHASILQYIRENAAFDSLFNFPQCDPLRVRNRITGILDPFEQDGIISDLFGVSLDELSKIIDGCLRSSTHGPSVVTAVEVHQKCGVPTIRIESALNILSRDSMNTEFLEPLSLQTSELHAVPLLSVRTGYLLLDTSLSASAFIEAILCVLRRHRDDVDKIVGLNGLENYVRNRLSDGGCSPAHGDYRSPNLGDAECDCIVESNKTVMLIEMKKKSLTQKSKSTDPVPLLIDLGRSLIAGHCQTGRHELALYCDGHIRLQRNIELRDRSVERIVISMQHFGTFHSRDVTSQFLSIMTKSAVTSREELGKSDARGIAELNKFCKTLERYVAKATEVGISEPHRFFNCWFLSLDIFDVMIDDSSCSDTLWDAVRATRHMSSGTRNWFAEYQTMKRIRISANANKDGG